MYKRQVINHLGQIQEGSAFNIDLSKELRKDSIDQSYPLYIAEIEGEARYIIPLRGKGLWGPIWGFISLENDLNTVYAAVFDHKSETPGLGAEINRPFFQDQFTSKTIMKDGEFVSITVDKKGAKGDIHKVDGISGGTITCNGVNDMIEERLSKYLPYFKTISTTMQVNEALEIVTIDELNDTTSNSGTRKLD